MTVMNSETSIRHILMAGRRGAEWDWDGLENADKVLGFQIKVADRIYSVYFGVYRQICTAL